MARPKKVAVAPEFTQTPEFAAAVNAAVDKAMGVITAQLNEAREPGAPVNLGDDAWARKLALAIAEVSDQGTKRKRVAPEILEAREQARLRMVGLLVDARAKSLPVVYTLRHKVYLDEIMIDPIYIGTDKRQHPQEIEWPGVPNHAMVPANEIAEAIYAEFMTSVGSVASVPGDDAEMRVTAGGLVVRGRAKRAEAPQTGAGGGEVGLKIRREAGTREGVVAVLGTVHPGARSTEARQAR